MIEAKQSLTGNITSKQSLFGELNKATEYIPPITQEKNAIPTKEEQTITPDEGFTGLSKVNIEAIPDEYIIPTGEIEITANGTYDVKDKEIANVDVFGVDVRDTTATESDVSNGKVFYKASGEKATGTASLGWDMTYVRTVSFSSSEVVNAPEFDTSKLTTISFSSCASLKTVPNYDLPSLTTLASAFSNCTSLEELTLTNLSNNLKRLYQTFIGCSSLKKVILNDTSGVTDIGNMFYNTPNLEYVGALDLSAITGNVAMFMGSTGSKVTYLGGFPNYGKSIPTTTSANGASLNLSYLSNLPRESALNVINSVYDIASKGCNTQKIQFNYNVKSKLTADEIKIATDKGWTIV